MRNSTQGLARQFSDLIMDAEKKAWKRNKYNLPDIAVFQWQKYGCFLILRFHLDMWAKGLFAPLE